MMDRLDAVLARWDRWWDHANDEPVLYVMYPTEEHPYGDLVTDWMAPACVGKWTGWLHEHLYGQAVELTHRTGDWRYVSEALDVVERYAEVTGYAAEGYRFFHPSLGPGCLSALITGFTRFKDSTIWLELDEKLTWEELLAIDETARDPYAETAIEAYRRSAERFEGVFVIPTPDLGGIFDILASLRGTNELLMDTIDRPDDVERVLGVLERLWYRYYEEFAAIARPVNGGAHTIVMRTLSSRPVNVSVCDFSAMISPEMFERFVLPAVRRECEYFDGRVIFHLDGPGEIPHLERLLSLEKLAAIQWVPGAGNPGSLDEHWYDLYRRILDAGKRISTGAGRNRDAIAKLFRTFPKEAFHLAFTASDAESARRAVELKEI
jgi:5-methyltetrahydrofolate--homocysteine methyltransferase